MTLRIPLNFDDVQEFDVLETGVYSAVIEKLMYSGEGQKQDGTPKSASIRVEYTLTEPDFEGRKVSQWLYLSPKAIFRAKSFFDRFDADIDELVLDEEEDDNGAHLVLEPDLSGEAVEIKIKKVPKWGDPDRDDNKVDDTPVRIGSAAKDARGRTERAQAKMSPAAKPSEERAAGRRPGGRAIR
jgi:hypothetical protein